MTAAIDITAGQRKTLLALLRRYIPGIAVWAYGSRVKWTARPNSDLDLVAFTTPEQQPLVSELKEALAESDLPFLVDFHVWDDVPERFHEIIRKEYVVLQEAKQLKSVSGKEGKWPVVTLEDVCETITDGAHLSPKDCPSGLPMASVKDMNRWGIDVKSSRTISQEDFDGLVRNGCQPKIGDVLIAKDGATCLDTVCEFKQTDKIVLLSSIAILRPSRQLHSGYLRYYLDSADTRAMLKAGYVSGSAIPRVVLKDFRRAPIVLPPLAEQKAIAHILGTLDDKIELNRRMNATLEAMARALFQSWFVDFDPVRAKLDGRQPADLDTATAALFPAHFQESPLGHIPQGWEVRSLDQVADYLNGLALQKYPPGDGETLPVIKIAQLRKGDSEGADRCNTELAPQYIVEDGDVLFSWSGSLEVELWCGGRGALNQHLFKVTSSDFPKWFYYHWTLYHLDEFRLIAADKATTMGHIQRGHLTAAKVLVPPPALLESMTRIMAPLIDQIIANRTQSRTLATIRDALLPKLLLGELNINITNEVQEVL
jgi:type I restriction enzyme S subunit